MTSQKEREKDRAFKTNAAQARLSSFITGQVVHSGRTRKSIKSRNAAHRQSPLERKYSNKNTRSIQQSSKPKISLRVLRDRASSKCLNLRNRATVTCQVLRGWRESKSAAHFQTDETEGFRSCWLRGGQTGFVWCTSKQQEGQ